MSNITAAKRRARVPLERTLVAVLEISQVINLSLGMREMLQLLAEKVHNLMGYDCAVVLLDADTLLLTWAGYYGLSDAYVQEANEQHNNLRTPEMAQGVTGRAYRSHRPEQINDIQDSSIHLWRDMLREEGIEAFVATPMVLHDRVLGFINCYSRQPHVFSRPEMDLMSIVANQAAIAVEAARLYEHERQRAAELDRLNRTLGEQHILLERQNAQLVQAGQIHSQLTEVILQDAGLEAIIVRVAKLVQRPVTLYDGELRELASSPADEPADLLHEVCLETKQLPATLLDGAEAREAFFGGSRPVRLHGAEEGGRFPRYVVPVRAGGSALAYLVVVEAPDRLEGLDLHAVEHGATAVALELLKQRAVVQVEQQLRGGFIDDLLSGEYESEESIIRRARHLGFDLGAAYRIFAIGVDPEPEVSGASPLDDLQRRVVSLAGSSWIVDRLKGAVTRKGDVVVVLWPERPETRISAARAARALAEDIRRGLRGSTVSVGIGSVCREPSDFAHSLAEARYCLEVLHRFGNANRTLTIEDLGLHRFLLRAKDEARLLEFAHRRLDRLLEHDRRHSVQLQKTLKAYLQSDCSLVRTAEQLALHVNTVQYRLRRIEDVSGVRLRSPQGLMEIQLALLIASLSPQNFNGLEADTLPTANLAPEM